ncbi:terpene synthase [Nostoc sphaeroides CHAB 2801]|uniref:terpene synthase family protein n=1 Tax=Nostoc sphaeroides TaxID=446679 RepID=UPI000E4B184A|nr:terpene synthase [Nostoc sphaeroides]MCC5634212.1 terpene synthase [Nostoc sphaeroides CHAB 2801]
MTEFFLPTLSCPFPSRLNKYTEQLEAYSISWLEQFNILKDESDYQRFSNVKFFMLAGSAYPDCQFEELKIANDWLIWLFIWDEQCDLSDLGKQPKMLENYHQRFLEVLTGTKPTNKDLAITHALYDIRKRMIEIDRTKKSFNYFVQKVKDYFQACVQESINRVENSVPSVEAYMKLRRLNGAVDACLELVIFCNHLSIPDFVRKHEIVEKIALSTNNVIAWDNDIISSYREITSGDIHNLIFIFKYHKHISISEAIRLAIIMRTQELEKIIALEQASPSFGEEIDAELAKYISGFKSCIRGNIDWIALTKRYISLEMMLKIAA